MQQSYLVYREPELIEELKSLLLLRYRVFRESQEKYAQDNRLGLELDCYDRLSHHFGFFQHEGGTSRAVGYVRMVTKAETRFANDITTIAKEVPPLLEKVLDVPADPYPALTHFPDRGEVIRHIDRVRDAGETLVEASRLSLDPSIRSLRAVESFVACTFAAFVVMGADQTIMTASPRHMQFYERFGFSQVEGTHDQYCPVVGTEKSCLCASAKALPSAMMRRVLGMAEAFSTTGRICVHPSAPGLFFAPTSSFINSRPVLRAA